MASKVKKIYVGSVAVHCAACGKLFYRFPSRVNHTKSGNVFCSCVCAGTQAPGRKPVEKIQRQCEICGNRFVVYPSNIYPSNKSNCGRFCSLACKRIWWSISRPLNCICIYCKKPFHLKPSKVLDNHGHFCSRACLSANARESYTCWQCGLAFTRKKSSKRIHPDIGRFCSKKCQSVYRGSHIVEGYKGRGRGGRRVDLENRYFRSSWEANWARYLNFLIKHGKMQSWDYECDTFEFVDIKRGNRSYTPDFKVINSDGTMEYQEVKGYMDDRSRVKLERMAKRYPQVKVVLIDKDVYYGIAETMKYLIPGWE